MKLVIFGLTISSSWGNAHAKLWRGLCRALADRGHTVVFFEHDVPYYAAHREVSEWRDGELCLYRDWNEVVAPARRHLAEADVALVTSHCPDGVAATELVLGSGARLKVFYDLDTPVTLAAIEEGKDVAYVGPRGLADFDLVLSYTGGRALDELRERFGARRVAPLYGSVDPDVHRPVISIDPFRCDLSYLGAYAVDRQTTLEALFIEPAKRLPHHRFILAGAQYPAALAWSDNISFVRHLEPAQHLSFFCSSRLTLNVTRRAMKVMGYCPSARLFEAAACGAPLLSDHWEGIDAFFEPGSEIIVARDSDEATAALRLPTDALQEMARRARERVLDEHTARHRVRYLETVLETAASSARGTTPAAGRVGAASEAGDAGLVERETIQLRVGPARAETDNVAGEVPEYDDGWRPLTPAAFARRFPSHRVDVDSLHRSSR